MSVVYKERDFRERDGGGARYTTVRRYRVPDRDEIDNVSVVKERDVVIRRDDAPVREVKELRVEREVEREPRRDLEYRVVTKEREIETPRRDIDVRVDRVVERERERDFDRFPRDRVYERDLVRVPSPERFREYRDIREFDRDRLRDSYDLERYTRNVDYYAPQPIIIRQEPIIIERDRPRYEMLERDDREDRGALVRRDEGGDRDRRRDEEDYYYERKTREIDRGPRRDGGGEAFDDREHRRRREIDPRDSASQGGYSSDDGVYVRKERVIERDRSSSPHHKLHIAEGAIAGIGAAEILRHHRKSKGEAPGHRGRQLVGGAALGAVGAEVISRARSRARSHRSRSRSSSSSSSGAAGYRRSRRRDRSEGRSRSRSKSRLKQLGGIAAVAAVGALAGYALRNKNKQQVIERRSRSRVRAGSVDGREVAEQRALPDGAPTPQHRNRVMAQAGLASAAAVGIWEKVTGRSRSRSRVQQAIPIAAAGLGGAAVAGLYERNKARKAAQRQETVEREFSRSPSRSRSRGAPIPYGDDPRAAPDNLIEYGDQPIYSERPGEYHRRHRGGSSDSSPDRRRPRSRSRDDSRSRTRGLAEAAAAAGVAGVAAHEYTKRSERKKADKERRRREREEELYAQENPPYTPPPMGANAGEYAPQHGYYPQGNSFPPPPTNDYAAREPGYPNEEYPPYNPSDYPPPPGPPPGHVGMPPTPGAEHYPPSPGGHYQTTGYVPNETYAGDTRYEDPQHHPGDPNAGRRGPENVSPEFNGDPRDEPEDGMRTPTRSKTVAFDVPGSGTTEGGHPSRSAPRNREDRRDRSGYESYDDGQRTPRRRRIRRAGRDEPASDSELYPPPSSGGRPPRDRHHRAAAPDTGPIPATDTPGAPLERTDSVQSDSTVELPPRFDEQGRPIPDENAGPTPLGDILGRSRFMRFANDLFTGGGEGRQEPPPERRSRRGR